MPSLSGMVAGTLRGQWWPVLQEFLGVSHNDDGTISDEALEGSTLATTVGDHIANESNPHVVTATQVGLGSVNNTSDANKPVSTATQTALDLKADQTDLDDLSDVVTTQGTAITTKADQTDLDATDATVATHTTQIGYTNPGSALAVGQYVGGGTLGAPVKVNERVFDVEHPRFGAVGDDTTNDRAAIQAAIDAAEAAGGGVVWLPRPVTYKVQITTATVDTSPASDGQHHLRIDGNNITLAGAPGAKISCLSFGGDPDTNWEVVTGAVWRGGGIFVSGGANWADRRRNVVIRDLEIDGNFTYTGNHGFPANTGTGDGWDVTHKGIWFEGDLYHDEHQVVNCHVHNFAGELVYTGGGDSGATPILGTFLVTDSHIHDTNGSAISMGGQAVAIQRNRIYTAAGAGVENALEDGHHRIFNNRIESTLLDSISAVGYNAGIGGYDICFNDLSQSNDYGVALYAAWNSQVHHNKIVDCDDGGIRLEVTGGYPNDECRDVDVCDNVVLADTQSMSHGINLILQALQTERVRIHRNRISRTKAAEAGPFIVIIPIFADPTTDLDEVDLRDNWYVGTNGRTNDAKAMNTLLTLTSEQYPAVFKPSIPTLLQVNIQYRVITGATDVTVKVYTNDATGASVVHTVQALTNKSVGTYLLPPYFVYQDDNNDCLVAVTAGTANQVYVSAIIREA